MHAHAPASICGKCVCVPQCGSVRARTDRWDGVRECVCVCGSVAHDAGSLAGGEAVRVCLVGCKTLGEVRCRMNSRLFLLQAARSVFRGRSANFPRLSCLSGLKHAVFTQSLETQAASLCQGAWLQRPPLLCTFHSERWGALEPHSHHPGRAHLSPGSILDVAQDRPHVTWSL